MKNHFALSDAKGFSKRRLSETGKGGGVMKKANAVIRFFLMLFVLGGLLTNVTLAAPAVLFIPLDDRPVCLEDTVATARAAGLEMRVPPAALLASRDRRGEPEQLWAWLKEEVRLADAVILSADSLIYGGLVPSRTHELTEAEIAERCRHIAELKAIQPNLRLYAFSTIMRSPKATAGGVDAAYYEKWGGDIFRLGALTDKRDSDGLSGAERSELSVLEQRIPAKYLADWRERRAKNIRNNLALWDLTEAGVIDYLLIGRDDAWPYSDSQRDLRWLLAQREGRPDPSRLVTLAAADQLGMLLAVRAANHFRYQKPFVAAEYGAGTGAKTVPTYQDESAGANITAQIWAAGAVPVADAERADLILAVHTPFDGVTKEAASSDNTILASASALAMAGRIDAWMNKGKAVAVADIAYGNGADNGFMAEMEKRQLLGRLAAYGGWNTASNSAGFALGQGLLAPRMKREAQQRLLAERFLDDWAYQANVRQEIIRTVLRPAGISTVRLGNERQRVEEGTTKLLREFAAQHLNGIDVPEFKAAHPWDRMFEVRIEFCQEE